MTSEELKKIIKNHPYWLNEDCIGWQNMRVDLSGADLNGADLSGANLRGAKNVPFIPMIPPERGSFIGFKTASKKIIVLMILADAKRSSATSRKCRCDKAIVLEIQELDGSISDKTEVTSDYDSNFIYKVGELVSVDNFDENRWQECAPGIHFFMSRQEAVDYDK